MEKDNNQRVADQREVIRDLQQKLSQAQDENEKKSLQLKLNVAQAKLEELENEQANEVSTSTPVTEGKATWKEQRANDLRQRIKRAMVQRDRAGGDAKKKWQEGINAMRRQLKKVLAEETPQNTKQFHNAITDGEYSDKLDESIPEGYSKSKFLKEMKDAVKDIKELADKTNRFIEKGNLDDIRLMFKSIKGYAEMVEGNCQDMVNQEKKGVLTEGCMTKKFENMTNKEIASYIFAHPHTKFASKMKECDDKEIMKAIRDMKKASEDAPVTNTSAVANPQGANSMYMKRPEPQELKDDYLKESVLPTKNSSWGFYGTIGSAIYDRNNKYDESLNKKLWNEAFNQLKKAKGWDDTFIRDWLDDKNGRHFADTVVDYGLDEAGIKKAIDQWTSRKWF